MSLTTATSDLPEVPTLDKLFDSVPASSDSSGTASLSSFSSDLSTSLDSCLKIRTDLESWHATYGGRRRSNSKVSFSSVKVHHHPIILGDNPSVSFGPPLTIDWESKHSVELCIESFESNRTPSRSVEELWLPDTRRVEMLRKLNVAEKAVRSMGKALLRLKKRQRTDTKKHLNIN